MSSWPRWSRNPYCQGAITSILQYSRSHISRPGTRIGQVGHAPHPSSQRARREGDKRDNNLRRILHLILFNIVPAKNRNRVTISTWAIVYLMPAIVSPEGGKRTSIRLVEISTLEHHSALRDGCLRHRLPSVVEFLGGRSYSSQTDLIEFRPRYWHQCIAIAPGSMPHLWASQIDFARVPRQHFNLHIHTNIESPVLSVPIVQEHQ
jgi:hypothetical protein